MTKFEKSSTVLFLILLLLSFVAAVFLILGENFQSLIEKKSKKQKILNITEHLSQPGVAVVTVYGPITITGVQSGFSATGGSDFIIKRLDKIKNDKKIKALVLRINSPGGTIASVQEIYAKLLQLKKRKIKIVVSMGDIAASGGYYIACAADKIVANPGTLTGSIGVIMESLDYSELFKKWGLHQNVIKSGKYKDIMSGHRKMTESERKLLQNVINDSYEQFLDIVALNRKIPKQKLRSIADGRIFDGRLAKKSGLIDELGTYENAIDLAKKIAKLPKNAPVYRNELTPFDSFLEQFNAFFNKKSKLSLPVNTLPFSYLFDSKVW